MCPQRARSDRCMFPAKCYHPIRTSTSQPDTEGRLYYAVVWGAPCQRSTKLLEGSWLCSLLTDGKVYLTLIKGCDKAAVVNNQNLYTCPEPSLNSTTRIICLLEAGATYSLAVTDSSQHCCEQWMHCLLHEMEINARSMAGVLLLNRLHINGVLSAASCALLLWTQ